MSAADSIAIDETSSSCSWMLLPRNFPERLSPAITLPVRSRIGAATQALLAQNGGWFDFTLRGDGFERRVVLLRTDADGVLSCRFEGIPYGTYILEENGTARCRVTVSAAQDDVTVALP